MRFYNNLYVWLDAFKSDIFALILIYISLILSQHNGNSNSDVENYSYLNRATNATQLLSLLYTTQHTKLKYLNQLFKSSLLIYLCTTTTHNELPLWMRYKYSSYPRDPAKISFSGFCRIKWVVLLYGLRKKNAVMTLPL